VGNRFRKREQVDLDLDSIWSFIAADSVDAAHRQIDRIGGVFEMLVQNPLAAARRYSARPAQLPGRELRDLLRSSA
jgi:toxin ParE1/3/4